MTTRRYVYIYYDPDAIGDPADVDEKEIGQRIGGATF